MGCQPARSDRCFSPVAAMMLPASKSRSRPPEQRRERRPHGAQQQHLARQVRVVLPRSKHHTQSASIIRQPVNPALEQHLALASVTQFCATSVVICTQAIYCSWASSALTTCLESSPRLYHLHKCRDKRKDRCGGGAALSNIYTSGSCTVHAAANLIKQ